MTETVPTKRSDILRNDILSRMKEMENRTFTHEPDYITTTFDEYSICKQKLYLMYLDTTKLNNKKKSASAYIGYAHDDVYTQVAIHNGCKNKGTEVDEISFSELEKTRHGQGNWELFMILYISDSMAKEINVESLLKEYWRSTHGIKSKVERAWELITLFKLRYFIPSAVSTYVFSVYDTYAESHKKKCTLPLASGFRSESPTKRIRLSSEEDDKYMISHKRENE